MADMVLRTRWDPGNINAMRGALASAAGAARNAFRGTSMTSPTSVSVPGLNISRFTSSLSVADRAITTSGQTYHRVVSGWISDIRRLDAAAAQGLKGYQGITFAGKGGVPSVYGTPSQPPVSRIPPAAGIGATRMGGIKEKISNISTGTWSTGARDINAVNNAIKALIPAFRQLEQLEMRAAQWAAKSEMWRRTWQTARGDLAGTQANLRSTLGTKEALFGGTPTQFLPSGAVIPGKLGAADPSEAKAIAQSETFRKLYRSRTTSGSTLRTKLKTNGLFDPTKAEEFVKQGIINPLGAGKDAAAIMRPVMPALLGDARGITKINAELSKTAAQIAHIDAMLAKLDSRTERFQRRQEQIRAAIIKRNVSQMAGFDTAFNTPVVPQGLNTLLGKYGPFRRDFISRMGIKAKYGTPGFAEEMERRGITADITRDFGRGTYQVSGTARDKAGFEGTYATAVSEKTGKTVEKWSGTMRNTQSFLRSLVVDFRKVIEWTLATTAVFGILGVTIGSFTKINDINSDLQRFQITAKTTGEETTKAFNSIVQVAIATATPLKEMTDVMDDIALATRRSNQTTEEWLKAQKKLAEGVGILTNISGLDTAKATDVLTSAYKQLGQGPEDLIPLLNKLTAVGGGNAQAITDIASAIGSLAEAAKAAGLSLDQQISAVQVLSQVTNKTAADTATAFKNLFGAINSPASEKMLKTFGIEIRDSAGNLRPFLDIYNDIYIARQRGIIQEGRYQDVLRAISGGPRRAPDAAALLSNLPKIFETLDISVNASNEALIANAKIMGTNKAKLQSLRTSFDAALVEKFTDAVNKLTEVLLTIGNVMTSAFGGMPSQLMSVILQMGLMVTAALLLRKVFSILRSEVGAFRGDLGNIGNAAFRLPGSAGRAERAVTTLPRIPVTAASLPRDVIVDRAGILRSKTIAGDLSEPRRQWTGAVNPYGIRYRDPGLHVPSGLPARQPYVRNDIPRRIPLAYTGPQIGPRITTNIPRPSTYAPLYKNVAITGQQVSMVGKLAGDVKNSIATGIRAGYSRINFGKAGTIGAGAAGIAGGLAIGAAAGSDASKLSGLTSVGMGVGGLLMMAGGPAGMAAGAGLLGVSAVLQAVSQDAIKAEENLNKMRMEVYDLSEAFSKQTSEVENAKKAQKDTSDAYDLLTNKSKAFAKLGVALAPEELARLVSLQKDYALSTTRVALAQEVLNEANQKLLETLPKLGKNYQSLIDLINGGVLSPEDATTVTSTLAQDILAMSGQYGAPNLDVKDFFKDIRSGEWLIPGDKGANKDVTRSVIEKASTGDWKAVLDALKGDFFEWGMMPGDKGYVTPSAEFLRSASYSIAAASPEDQLLPEYRTLIELFGKYVQQFGDNSSRISGAVSTYGAQVQARGATKLLVGEEYQNALGKATLSQRLKSLRSQVPATPRGTISRAYGPSGKPQLEQLDDLIEKIVTMDMGKALGVEDAMAAYTEYAKIMDIYDDLQEKGVLQAAAVDWYNAMGISVGGLTDKVKGLQQTEEDIAEALEKQAALRDSMRGAFEGTAQSLGGDLLNLQAAYQSGEFKDKEVYYTRQVAQINALIAANKALNAATAGETEPQLQALGDSLSRVTGLYGLQYASVDQITGAVINWGRVLGLTPKQIGDVITAVVALNKALKILESMQELQIKIKINIATIRGKDGGAAEDDLRNIDAKTRADAKTIAAQQAEVARLEKLLADLGKLGNNSYYTPPDAGSAAKATVGALDIPQEWIDAGVNIKEYLNKAIKNAAQYQSQIPGEAKEHATDLVAIMNDNKRILLKEGIAEEYLRQAIDDLTEEMKKANDLAKADTIGRIRVGMGDFAAFANVPINRQSGISVGGPQGPITISVNVTGQILTEAQLLQLQNQLGAAIGRQISTN